MILNALFEFTVISQGLLNKDGKILSKPFQISIPSVNSNK